MREVILENQTADGQSLRATFLPDQGMNLCSYTRGDTEVIAQDTRALFEERCAGLGALIGPHFHRRNPRTLPKIPNEEAYPHIARVRKKGVEDPFSHGIARYAPWSCEQTGSSLKAKLNGKDEWMGTPLAQLQGQDFRMTMDVDLSPEGLHLNLSVISDFDSLVGIHYYYALPNGKGRVHSDVRPTYRDGDEVKDLPTDWEIDAQNGLSYDLSHAADYGFYPYKNPCGAHIVLDTEAYRLHTEYSTTCQENTWQLYRPAGAEFVCVEPMTAQDPRKPLLSVSSISIDLRIEAPKA